MTDTELAVRPRLTMRRFLAELTDEVFSLDRGLPWTLWRMFVDPRSVVRGYIEGRDARATKPVRYFLIVAVAVTLAGAWLETRFPGPPTRPGIEASGPRGNVAASDDPAAALKTRAHQVGYELGHFARRLESGQPHRLLLALLPFLAAGLFVAFHRQQLNFAEHWVVAMYVTAQLYLVGGIPARFLGGWAGGVGAFVYAVLPALFLYLVVRIYDGPVASKLASAVFAFLLAAFLLLVTMLAYLLVRVMVF